MPSSQAAESGFHCAEGAAVAKAPDPNLVDQVRQWLLARSPEFSEIDMDLDLIDTRVLDSLDFIQFIVFLEELVGREIETTSLTANSFRTLRLIEENILFPRESE